MKLKKSEIPRLRQALLAWYRAGHRKLPWRRDRDPYRILISESMLVQTTATAVAPYFHRFLERFPTLEALAQAHPEAVLKAWEGLGYYRRARQLHAAAQVIHARHQGVIPRQRAALEDLPGIGPYIAGAILSFAFDQPEPILEANSQRVLARLIAWQGELQRSESRNILWQTARALVAGDHPGEFNQALIELGATLCSPRQPRCLACPWNHACQARAEGLQDVLPRSVRRPVPQDVHEECLLVAWGESLFAIQRPEDAGLWAAMWEFPTTHLAGPDPANRAATRNSTSLTDLLNLPPDVSLVTGPVMHTVKYTVTRYRVTLDARVALVRSRNPGPEPHPHARARWVRLDDLNQLIWGSAGRKLIHWLNHTRGRDALLTHLHTLRTQTPDISS